MTESPKSPLPLPELPAEVRAHIEQKLGTAAANKISASIRTASKLIKQAAADGDELRLAESAAYNIREALDAVVAGRPPGDGIVARVATAWERYQLARHQPDTERAQAWAHLADVLNRAASNEGQLSRRDLQILDYLRAQAGIEPLPDQHSPVNDYAKLCRTANEVLHGRGELALIFVLYEDAVSWFLRMFTPPDAKVRAIIALAKQTYQHNSQIDELRRLITDAHHVRLFLQRVTDPAWLTPLHHAGLIQPPRAGEPWPVLGLIDGLGADRPDAVVAVLDRLLDEIDGLDVRNRPGVAFEIVRAASHLGTAVQSIAVRALRMYPTDSWIQTIAVSVAKDADPADAVVLGIADLVIGNEARHDGGKTRVLLERLEAGTSPENLEARTRMVAAKVRRMSRDERLRVFGLDNAALTAPLGDEREDVIVVAHFLARFLARARELGIATPVLLEWVRGISGELSERIICRAFVNADDVALADKIEHVAQRLGTAFATGDDRDLIRDILDREPTPDRLRPWREALGEPSDTPQGELNADTLPLDWRRVWTWSVLLPEDLLVRWREPIALVTATAGNEPSVDDLMTRSARVWTRYGESPYSVDELASLDVPQAAAAISAWRPDTRQRWETGGAIELARTLQLVVANDLDAWTRDPSAVVTALREPAYVQHYLRALTNEAGSVADRTPEIVSAARLVRSERWGPTRLGDPSYDDFQPDRTRVDVTTVDLIAALANRDADLRSDLDEAWQWAVELIRRAPRDQGPPDTELDPLNRAINTPWGRGLDALLALARWEARNLGTVRTEFTQVLDEIMEISGATGLRLRAILALRRLAMEAIAPEWLEANADSLFRVGELAQETFELTIKWSRPTSSFVARYRRELLDAVRRGAEHAAAWLVLAVLHEEPDYDAAEVVRALGGDENALAAVAEETAAVVSDSEESPQLAAAVDLWRTLLASDAQRVPAAALRSLGRWAYAPGVDRETWGALMLQTLERTDGEISDAMEVAQRSAETMHGMTILRSLLGKGEPWQRSRIEDIGLGMLRQAATGELFDADFQRLRERLIEVGRPEAADIGPPDTA